jgi:hypothetical protein
MRSEKNLLSTFGKIRPELFFLLSSCVGPLIDKVIIPLEVKKQKIIRVISVNKIVNTITFNKGNHSERPSIDRTLANLQRNAHQKVPTIARCSTMGMAVRTNKGRNRNSIVRIK